MADLENLKSNETIPWDIDFGNTIGELDKLEWEDPELEEAKRIIEEWDDTNLITKLTPELVEMLPNNSDEYEWHYLPLNWLKTIETWVAEKIANHFAWFDGKIWLNWLENIDKDAVKALDPILEKIYVPANVFETIRIGVELDELELEVVKRIIEEWEDTNMIRKLTPELVEMLPNNSNEYEWHYLPLNWLKTIETWVAEKIANHFAWFDGQIWLNWLENVDKDVARALAPIKEKINVPANVLKKIEEVEKE